jgi:radical SAM superfamily enzyme YgiQ (UPF0313 family)
VRVLFVYSNQVRDLLPAPPIGLSYVASATADAGHQVDFIDLLLTDRGLQQLERRLRDFAPEVVAISVRNIDNVIHQRLLTHLDELARQTSLIRRHSRASIVVGGPAISVLGCQVLQHIDADFAVLGEGEESFPALLEQIAGEGAYWKVPGICIHGPEEMNRAVAPKRAAGFGASGMQRWLKNWRAYERQGATWPLQSKRGCPLHCTYCTYPGIEGRNLRHRPPEEIVEEMRQVQREVNPRCFEFIDSVFNMPESYAMELCDAVIRSGLKVNLTTMGVNPRFLSAELLASMKRAGFNSLMITPESASDPVLEAMKKGFSREDAIRAAELVRRSEISSMWFFMLGAPGETRDTAEETVSFAERFLNWRGALSMFTTGIRILPGTELAQQSIAEGYLPADQNFTESVFYFSPEVSEQWLLERVDQAIRRCPTVVHAAEDPSGTPRGMLVHRLMHLARLSPPYWRYLPSFLSLPLVHKARVRQPYTQQILKRTTTP